MNEEKECLIEEIREEWPAMNEEEESAFEAFCEDYLNSKW